MSTRIPYIYNIKFRSSDGLKSTKLYKDIPLPSVDIDLYKALAKNFERTLQYKDVEILGIETLRYEGKDI